ncbi:hypothetical protein M409DRAFT_56831 [Zasmidium cellare ATCC 36951]|uniref:BTB domain-containing protein n=1 Tax=Zasmidium cellare ATCC 36951 TaxID=1080233 RepID=A0A6A6CD36_ZASCE|nr:uncharacterized protein M409DRAFT_56831 [Zasmidium cellare ATCC 36951]KAF2164120.1 hypothetical protein M409DRAFT_56831 [Zasmidium cellare ATCC 36951]
MVDYFYHPKTCLTEYISQASVENDESSPSIADHMAFFADTVLLADMYNVKGLKNWATECFKEWFHEERDIKWIDRALDTFDEQDNMPDWIWEAMVRAVVRVLEMNHEYTVAETTSLFTKHPKLAVAIANDMAARHFVGTYDNEVQPNDGQSDDDDSDD